MASDITKNPHLITGLEPAFTLLGRNIRIHGVRWLDAAGSGTCEIWDGNGNVLYKMTAGAIGANQTQESKMHTWARGGYQVTMSQGSLYIYLEEGLAA